METAQSRQRFVHESPRRTAVKRLVLGCTLTLGFAGWTVAKAEAQFCWKFQSFCDGIQVDNISCKAVNAQWYHFDCTNSTPMSNGGWAPGDVRSSFPYRYPYANPCPHPFEWSSPSSRDTGGGDCVEGCGPCGGPMEALITCKDCLPGLPDFNFYFVIDEFEGLGDGTLDMVSGVYPSGLCWIDQLAYSIQIGPCTTPQQQGAGPSQMQERSSIE